MNNTTIYHGGSANKKQWNNSSGIPGSSFKYITLNYPESSWAYYNLPEYFELYRNPNPSYINTTKKAGFDTPDRADFPNGYIIPNCKIIDFGINIGRLYNNSGSIQSVKYELFSFPADGTTYSPEASHLPGIKIKEITLTIPITDPNLMTFYCGNIDTEEKTNNLGLRILNIRCFYQSWPTNLDTIYIGNINAYVVLKI